MNWISLDDNKFLSCFIPLKIILHSRSFGKLNGFWRRSFIFSENSQLILMRFFLQHNILIESKYYDFPEFYKVWIKLAYQLQILFLGKLFEIVSFSLMLNCKTMKGNKYCYQSSSPLHVGWCWQSEWGWSPQSPVVPLQLTVSVLNYQPPLPPPLPHTTSTILQYITKHPKLLGSTCLQYGQTLHSSKCCLSTSTLLLFFLSSAGSLQTEF